MRIPFIDNFGLPNGELSSPVKSAQLQRTDPQGVGLTNTSDKTLDTNQIQFLKPVIDYLTHSTGMSAP
jgi:hypothetical protein